jgi:hypothetical protein
MISPCRTRFIVPAGICTVVALADFVRNGVGCKKLLLSVSGRWSLDVARGQVEGGCPMV